MLALLLLVLASGLLSGTASGGTSSTCVRSNSKGDEKHEANSKKGNARFKVDKTGVCQNRVISVALKMVSSHLAVLRVEGHPDWVQVRIVVGYQVLAGLGGVQGDGGAGPGALGVVQLGPEVLHGETHPILGGAVAHCRLHTAAKYRKQKKRRKTGKRMNNSENKKSLVERIFEEVHIVQKELEASPLLSSATLQKELPSPL